MNGPAAAERGDAKAVKSGAPLYRVAFVLPPFTGGGAQRVLLTLLAGLNRAEFETSLIVFPDSGHLETLCPRDAQVAVLGRL